MVGVPACGACIVTAPTRAQKRRQNIILAISYGLLLTTPIIGTLVGTGSLPFVAP